ncbi:PIN domain-containing protein [archaeon]|nr:PIN domain-containing protein [archaeon]
MKAMINIEVKKLEFRDENKVSFDTMVFIDLTLTEEAKVKLLEDWQATLKKTKFYVSTKVINETFGVMTAKLKIDWADAKNKIKKVKEALSIEELGYDKTIDNKQGFLLLEKYREKYGDVDIDKHINDGRIVAHLKREGINVIYSKEELVRKLAELAGLEGRDFILSKFRQKSR